MIPTFIRFQLYLLQLENYHLKRYLRVAMRKIRSLGTVPRQELVWTPKLRVVFVGALILQALCAAFFVLVISSTGTLQRTLLGLLLYAALFTVHFIFLTL